MPLDGLGLRPCLAITAKVRMILQSQNQEGIPTCEARADECRQTWFPPLCESFSSLVHHIQVSSVILQHNCVQFRSKRKKAPIDNESFQHFFQFMGVKYFFGQEHIPASQCPSLAAWPCQLTFSCLSFVLLGPGHDLKRV